MKVKYQITYSTAFRDCIPQTKTIVTDTNNKEEIEKIIQAKEGRNNYFIRSINKIKYTI